MFTRLGSDPATRAYAERRTAEGKSKKEIIRCLKRYVAREVYPHLRGTAGIRACLRTQVVAGWAARGWRARRRVMTMIMVQ